MSRLQTHYQQDVVKKLVGQFGYKSVMQVPRIEKITLNMGVGEAVERQEDHGQRGRRHDQDRRPEAARDQVAQVDRDLQDPRQDYPIGCKVTLRGTRMYEFLDRLVTVAIPRIRDFRGIPGTIVRRPRQLQLRHQGTDHFPRDRVRQDRCIARHEHHDHHHRQDRRRRRARCSRHSNFRSGTRPMSKLVLKSATRTAARW